MSFTLPDPIALDLLHKLGNDDGFREVFAADPRAALASLGFGPAADPSVETGIWMCLRVEALASKEAVRASHGALLRQITAAKAAQNPLHLQVAPVTSRRAA
jgi:putative modified peptide